MINKFCTFGDGNAQLQLFHDIEQYALKNDFVIQYGTQMNHDIQTEVIVAKSQKFNLIAVKERNIKINTQIASPRFYVLVNNNKTHERANHVGTIAGMLFNMFFNKGNMQK